MVADSPEATVFEQMASFVLMWVAFVYCYTNFALGSFFHTTLPLYVNSYCDLDRSHFSFLHLSHLLFSQGSAHFWPWLK